MYTANKFLKAQSKNKKSEFEEKFKNAKDFSQDFMNLFPIFYGDQQTQANNNDINNNDIE